MARLIASGHETAIAYEKALRADRRLDYDDLIRHAARLMAIPAVARLYQQHFALVLVDEVQDLSMLQYRLVAAVGGDKITFAGDPAQGIYSFAGADPDGVFAAIDAQHPEVVEFKLSYRSSPAVLRAINALATEMQSTQLTCADEHRWEMKATCSVESHDTDLEAARPSIRWGNTVSKNPRTSSPDASTPQDYTAPPNLWRTLRAAARERGIPFEDWALATHVPEVVERLKRAYTQAARQGTTDTEVLHHLSQLCRASLDSDDADTLDELASALEQLEEAMAAGTSLRDALAGCRVSPDPSAPVAPGLHLLTGHKGKGQEFDWVIVLGLEAGHIPDFRNEDDHQVNEELRVLHVMASRARYGLAFTYSRATRTKYGWRDSAPSRWLDLVNSAATERRAS
ncbi:MAG: ATP-dependent helicase [Ilumatobacteraceae bacterium]